MTAAEALKRTETNGFNHIMCCIAARCDDGFTSIRLYPEIIERFRDKLEANGFIIKDSIVSWSKPKSPTIVFNQ